MKNSLKFGKHRAQDSAFRFRHSVNSTGRPGFVPLSGGISKSKRLGS